MGLYPSQTALSIRCCVQEREHDLHSDTSDDEELRRPEKEAMALPWHTHSAGNEPLRCLPRSVSSRTTLPIVK